MRAERVTLKRQTLWKLREAVETGDRVTALEILDQCLDIFRQSELQRCKNLVYQAFREGRLTYEQYRARWEQADEAQR